MCARSAVLLICRWTQYAL